MAGVVKKKKIINKVKSCVKEILHITLDKTDKILKKRLWEKNQFFKKALIWHFRVRLSLFHKQIYQMENKMIVKYYVLDDFYIKHIWMCVYVSKYNIK